MAARDESGRYNFNLVSIIYDFVRLCLALTIINWIIMNSFGF